MSDFTSRFTFTIYTQGSSTYGHGVAFFLAPVASQIPPNSAGGFLGLFNTTTSDSSTNQIVLVEFDTFPNPEWDTSVEHVGKKTTTPLHQLSTHLGMLVFTMEALPEWVVVGFSAATGQNIERQTLQSWEFSSSLDIKNTIRKNAKVTSNRECPHYAAGV
ncbi:L-type lectin-domain containing receptor kinase IX.1-like [Durio zibethinus]|uniref:L-type lectin-domain containing receptor kinase IX.1-like n=1 Tax=Durio zibethinus TaxID=66656 RepID=A0A6P5ZIB5_DURZI|nr:L-type lectin-domain containing receptor kinase IX.1-like [Durio zibethinus]